MIAKPGAEGRFLPLMDPGSHLELDRDVPRLVNGRPREAALADADGWPRAGGAQQLAVRRMPEAEFAAIVRARLPDDLAWPEAMRHGPGLVEPFERPVLERLASRPYRDLAFLRKLREAYGSRREMSGQRLRTVAGRPEVNAAHIRPVAWQGSGSVRNGPRLSETLHWMFDPGFCRWPMTGRS